MLNILLMAPQQGQDGTGGGSGYMNIIMFLLIGVIFYFFMIRPQTKKMKDQKRFMDEVKKGDKIVTIGGIHGKIAEINDDHFIMEIENGVRMKIEKSSVSLDMSKKVQDKK